MNMRIFYLNGADFIDYFGFASSAFFQVETCIPKPKRSEAESVNIHLRELIKLILCVRSGCAWRLLPTTSTVENRIPFSVFGF